MTENTEKAKTDDCRIICGDSLLVLPTLDANSFDSCVCDPPYGLSKEPDVVEVLTHWMAGDAYSHKANGFMGRSWDSFVPGPEYWREVYRVLKPGAYLLCFASTRTDDLMSIAIRMAGFVKHPFLAWIFGSGFPKAHNLSKQIDKMHGSEREVVGEVRRWGNAAGKGRGGQHANDYEPTIKGSEKFDTVTAPATDEAKQWDGWFYGKQSLKPAMEPILMFQKPFEKGLTGAQNVLKWGTGAINIDACRVEVDGGWYDAPGDRGHADNRTRASEYAMTAGKASENGRWPANVITDGSDEVLTAFPHTASGQPCGIKAGGQGNAFGEYAGGIPVTGFGDEGSASRFFYTAKASKHDREAGLNNFPSKEIKGAVGIPVVNNGRGTEYESCGKEYERNTKSRNHHPCVKPVSLMQYLVKLVTPPNGLILDPFLGSGSTAKAALIEHFRIVGIEIDSEYATIAEARCKQLQVKLFV